MKRMLHRTIPLLAALALSPVFPANAEEPQAALPSKRAAEDRSDDRSPAKAEPGPAGTGDPRDEKTAPPSAKPPKGGGPPPAPRAAKKDEKAPAKPAADAEKPCVPVKPCAID
jgi:hypothetical protein